MKRKLIISIIVSLFFTCFVIPSGKAAADVRENSNNSSFDISKLNEKMQTGAVFTGVEYGENLYFICDAKLYKYTAEQAQRGKEPTLLIDNAVRFWIENDAIFFSKSYENAVYRTDLDGRNKKILSKRTNRICLTDFHMEGYFYLWDKNKFYRVSESDGSRTLLAKYRGSYNASNRGRSVYFYGDKLFYSYGFADENGSYASYPGKNCDYRIYSENTDGTGRKSVLNPKGANQEFRFFEIEGHLFAVSGNDIYRYNEKKGKFKKVRDTAFPTYMYYGEDFEGKRQYDILGSDGTYLYLYRITTEIPKELEDSTEVRVDQCINTVNIYRVGADWQLKTIFSGVNLRVYSNIHSQGYIISDDEWLGLDYADENYLYIRYGDEDILTFIIGKEGNYLFSLGYFATEEDIPANYDADESTVQARIRDGKVYVIEHDGGGHVGAVKIIPLEEAIAKENDFYIDIYNE